jgi:hypothetical protein
MAEDIVEILKARCEDAKTRMESAQEDYRKYRAVLELELKKRGRNSGNGNGRVPIPPRNPGEAPVPPNFARMKYDSFRSVVIAEGPVDAASLVKLLGGRLSRSYTYFLIKELKKTGELIEDAQGRVSIRRDQEQSLSAEVLQ